MAHFILVPDIDALLSAAEARLSGENLTKSTKKVAASIAVSHPAPEPEKKDLTVRQVVSPSTQAKGKTDKPDTAGPGWYNLPKTNLTPELKRDLQLLRLRNAFDPKVHYKKQSLRSQVPRYSHVGEVIAGPTEYYSARMTRKQKQRTFTEEILATEHASGKFKSKYSEIQVAKTSGRKASYKAHKAIRRGGK